MFDWNDLRFFLAVAKTGSTLGAGRVLRVSQTTAARRVAALEQALGLTLFDRRQAGYVLTPNGESLLATAHDVEDKATAFDEASAARRREAGGVVRVTTSEIYAMTLLAPIIRDLHEEHPGIFIELDTTDALRDLERGAADIALRVAERLTGGGLVARRLFDDAWTVYCSLDYAKAHGRPTRRSELVGHPMIGGGEEGVWRIYQIWLRENGLEDAVVFHHGSSTGLLSAVRSGLGLAVLPCSVADTVPDLVRCLPPMRETKRGVWLLTHERLRHTPRIRTVLDFLAERLKGASL